MLIALSRAHGRYLCHKLRFFGGGVPEWFHYTVQMYLSYNEILCACLKGVETIFGRCIHINIYCGKGRRGRREDNWYYDPTLFWSSPVSTNCLSPRAFTKLLLSNVVYRYGFHAKLKQEFLNWNQNSELYWRRFVKNGTCSLPFLSE